METLASPNGEFHAEVVECAWNLALRSLRTDHEFKTSLGYIAAPASEKNHHNKKQLFSFLKTSKSLHVCF